MGGSHDSGNGLKLSLLSRLEGETSLEWSARGANVSSDETLLRDMAAMSSQASTGGWWLVVGGGGGGGGDGVQVELSFAVPENVTTVYIYIARCI